MKKIYQEYADLKEQAKEIDLKIKAINPLIVEDMKEKGNEKLSTTFGNFIVKPLKSWKYSDAVDNAKAKLVTLQTKEQKTEVAVLTIKPSLTFNAPKHE